jgi:cell division septation protein DedD
MAIAIIVLIATSAGFYFLVLRPSHPQGRAVTDSVGKAQVSAVQPLSVPAGAANSEAVAAAVAKQSDDAAAATSKPADSAVEETTASNENSALGQFSLQAAAFPTQSGADEFAEKLKQAGLASYVVPADIARRGRWFRVRVGRFDSAENAQKFAGEAQRRARSAGLSLQLIVCQYGKP